MNIEVQSHWGASTRNAYIIQNNDTLDIILPGGNYTTMAPLLYYAYNAAMQCGYDILAVEYGFQRYDCAIELNGEAYCHLVNETAEAISQCHKLKYYKKIIFIGKCLGTYIQTRLMDALQGYEQKHIFFTPWPECIEGIKNANCLVIVGTSDPVFKKEDVKAITGYSNVKKIFEGADHNLEKEAINESLDILADITESVCEFIK